MTVSECIKDWLCGFDGTSFSDLATDFIQGENESYAIYKSPNRNVVIYSDGSRLVTEYYNFFARESTIQDTERIQNQQFLSDLENWVEEKDFKGEYPDFSASGTMECQGIQVSNSATITSQEDDNAIYQITIAVEYLKER